MGQKARLELVRLTCLKCRFINVLPILKTQTLVFKYKIDFKDDYCQRLNFAFFYFL